MSPNRTNRFQCRKVGISLVGQHSTALQLLRCDTLWADWRALYDGCFSNTVRVLKMDSLKLPPAMFLLPVQRDNQPPALHHPSAQVGSSIIFSSHEHSHEAVNG